MLRVKSLLFVWVETSVVSGKVRASLDKSDSTCDVTRDISLASAVGNITRHSKIKGKTNIYIKRSEALPKGDLVPKSFTKLVRVKQMHWKLKFNKFIISWFSFIEEKQSFPFSKQSNIVPAVCWLSHLIASVIIFLLSMFFIDIDNQGDYYSCLELACHPEKRLPAFTNHHYKKEAISMACTEHRGIQIFYVPIVLMT